MSQLYLSSGEGSAGLRLATAMKYMSLNSGSYQPFLKFLAGGFVAFVEGHFMNLSAFIENFQSISRDPLQQESEEGAPPGLDNKHGINDMLTEE